MNTRPTHFEYFGIEDRPDPAVLRGRKLLFVWLALILLSWVLVIGLVGAVFWLF